MSRPAGQPTETTASPALGVISPGGPPPIQQTVAAAARLVFHHRRQILLPLAAIQVPVALVTATTTLLLYFTVFEDKAEVVPPGVLNQGDRAQLFAAALLIAVEGLFTLVARGASILAIAGAARGERVTLTGALDPAFTRLGGLLLIIAIGGGAVLLGVLTVIGLPFVLYGAVRFILVFDAFMIDRLAVFPAFRRSWNLTHRHMLRLLGVVALGSLIALPAVFLLSLLSAIGSTNRNAEILLVSGAALVQSILIIPVVAFATATTTLFYLRLKANSDARTTA